MVVPVFLSLLIATALGSLILYQRTKHDIYGVLAITSIIVSVIWSLAMMHWLIHLAALLIILRISSPRLKLSTLKNIYPNS